MRTCLVKIWPRPLVGAVVCSRNTCSTKELPLPPSPLQVSVERYLVSHKVKSNHQVFASFSPDQLLLSDMLRYVREIDAARERVRVAKAGLESEARAKLEEELDAMTEEQVETLALKCGGKKIKRPMCASVPFKPSGDVGVRTHLAQKRNVNSYRTPLLCNSGVTGSGKSVLMLHSTAAAIPILERKINKQITNADERRIWRPLGFYVSFNTPVTAMTTNETRRQDSILTLIALRMAFSVLDDERCTYKAFSNEMFHLCHLDTDEENCMHIIKALRTVLKWSGPMFVAMDEFKRAFPEEDRKIIVAGLKEVCTRLIDAASLLPIDLTSKDFIYDRYVAVSAYNAVDPVALATQSLRKLIVQPMPMFGLRTIGGLIGHIGKDTPPMMAAHYSKIFRPDREILKVEELLFLIHLALLAGRPRIVFQFLENHANDVPGRFKQSSEDLAEFKENSMWLQRDATDLGHRDEEMCLCACALVVGLSTTNIFLNKNADTRAFALSSKLEYDCVFTQVTPTRALVSPRFLHCISSHWPKVGEKHSISLHVEKLHASLNKQVDLAMVLVEAGPSLIANPHQQRSVQLVEDWKKTTSVAFDDLLFHALCLRFACVLSTAKPTGLSLIDGAHSKVEQAGFFECVFVSAPLVQVPNIVNFPSMFFDAYRLFDTKSTSNGVSGASMSSYEALQGALAKGDHFAFQPSNPNNQGEDGVIFLRETSEPIGAVKQSWTVIMVQNKHWWDEYQAPKPGLRRKHVLDMWRGNATHLPAVIRDTTGAVHNLRYVRMLATINPIKRGLGYASVCPSEQGKVTPNNVTMRYAKDARKPWKVDLAKANAAFIKLVKSRQDRSEIENAVYKWATTDGASVCLLATDRATALVKEMNLLSSPIRLSEEDRDSMGSGPVIAEFLMDLDDISKWCPTVGMFASNIVKIRELMDTPDSASSEPTTSAKK
ncbi:multi-copy leucine-rich repeat protein, putative [Bodo saltans]|uniref:Multi-copy leucine-rich repeat protein, putative n=1 Tax=Bodo saltans TaxID=75058 RepID=A0A0S4IUM9_BODSA|nr:multi-copy leucine-rich repeat protein, putative [Bodo saltans]|eukprot:CUF95080.1 multi-copy leucine-rich repeat protein, putative [Bodo saltans]